jgi:methylation protein EvaC
LKGVFVFEEPYLGSMFDKVSYDQIYDEHIYMFSVSSVQKIFSRFDMELIEAHPQETHGGSMRYVIARKNQRDINDNLKNIIQYEKEKGIDNLSSCLKFKKNCELSKKKIVNLLNKHKNQNKRICGYAATSKSTTVLNYCQIGINIIDCIYDTTKEKIGKFSPGMHIPIISAENFVIDGPDVSYLFAWNHKKEIFKKEKNFLSQGGTWISHVNI